LTRIEPPYLVATVLLFAAGVAAHGLSTGAAKWPALAQWPNLVASLFYQHNLVYGQPSVITPVAWSLEIEVQFYLLAPFLAVAFSLRNTVVRRIVFAVGMVAPPLVRSLLPADFAERYNSLPWYLEYFACGFLLADLFLVGWKQAPRRSLAADTLTLVGWPALAALIISGQFPALLAPAALACYVGAFRGAVSNRFLSRPLVTTIGGMCYSIYLLHYTVLMATGALTRRLGNLEFPARLAIDALVGLPAVLLVTVAFYVVLERRCMDPAWPARLARRFSPERPLSPAVDPR
jgi:peptidoglycan/LPS O-acetylase OafA/YrhL